MGAPTAEQLEVLRAYAKEHGRTWKADLNHDWMTGQTCGPLQEIRNQFGPSWLVRFRLKGHAHLANHVETLSDPIDGSTGLTSKGIVNPHRREGGEHTTRVTR